MLCPSPWNRGRPETKGWRLYRADDADEGAAEVTVLAAYCPACAVREFGVQRADGADSPSG
jgi:hypothetical protein